MLASLFSGSGGGNSITSPSSADSRTGPVDFGGFGGLSFNARDEQSWMIVAAAAAVIVVLLLRK